MRFDKNMISLLFIFTLQCGKKYIELKNEFLLWKKNKEKGKENYDCGK